MKKLIFIMGLNLLFGIIENVFSQELLTYQGPYKNGTASYQYSEGNNFERVFQGPFKYSEDEITITGQFINNKKNGQWVTIKVDKAISNGKPLKKEILTGQYLNDQMEGLWSIERTDLEKNKPIISSQVNFKDGYLVGSFKYYNSNSGFILNNIEQINELSLIGNFDSKGYFDSVWIASYKINNIPYELIRKFKSGLLFFELKRNLSTGEILNKYDNPAAPVKYPHFKGAFEYSVKFVTCITNYPDELYSQVLNIWECIKKPNTYEYKNLNSYESFSNYEHENVLVGQSYNPEDYIDPRIETKKNIEQSNKQKLNSLIFKADSLFNIKKYDDAELYYIEAETYPFVKTPYIDSQLSKIKDIRDQQDPVVQDMKRMQQEAEQNRASRLIKAKNIFKNP